MDDDTVLIRLRYIQKQAVAALERIRMFIAFVSDFVRHAFAAVTHLFFPFRYSHSGDIRHRHAIQIMGGPTKPVKRETGGSRIEEDAILLSAANGERSDR